MAAKACIAQDPSARGASGRARPRSVLRDAVKEAQEAAKLAMALGNLAAWGVRLGDVFGGFGGCGTLKSRASC